MKLRQLSTNKTSITFFQNLFPHWFKANPQSLPEQTVLRYSITQHLDEIIGCVLGPIFLGSMVILKAPKILDGYFLFIVGIALGYYIFRKRFYKKYRIALTREGIQFSNGPLYKWRSIRGIRVTKDYSSHYLIFQHAKGEEKIQIDGYKVDPAGVRELLKLYRKNNQAK